MVKGSGATRNELVLKPAPGRRLHPDSGPDHMGKAPHPSRQTFKVLAAVTGSLLNSRTWDYNRQSGLGELVTSFTPSKSAAVNSNSSSHTPSSGFTADHQLLTVFEAFKQRGGSAENLEMNQGPKIHRLFPFKRL